MDTKLTLKLDESIIAKAKLYADAHKRSLSNIVETYLKALVSKDEPVNDEVEISSFVKSISEGINIPNDIDYKNERFNYLNEKYK